MQDFTHPHTACWTKVRSITVVPGSARSRFSEGVTIDCVPGLLNPVTAGRRSSKITTRTLGWAATALVNGAVATTISPAVSVTSIFRSS